ncbi:MAG TPA: condensation domain-containing protein [Gemmatimonadales bacterium]|nr:condensation domain-containing protein [Gemmatimonadales bacterium]
MSELTAPPPAHLAPIGPLSEAQARLWTLETQLGAGAVHVFAIAHELIGPLDANALEAAMAHVARLHPALRVRVGSEAGQFVFFPTEPPTLVRLGADAGGGLDAALASAAEAKIDLGNGPGWHATLVTLTPERRVLLLQFHHLIADRVSAGVFSTDLSAAYRALVSGTPLPAPPALNRPLGGTAPTASEAEALLEYWRTLFAVPPEPLQIPGAFTEQNFHSYEGERLQAWLGRDVTAAAKAASETQQTSLFTVLLAAFAATLHAHTGQQDIVICTTMAARHRGGTRRAIGYFNNIVPLRLDLSGDPSGSELMRRIAVQLHGAMTNQDMPFHDIAGLPVLTGDRLTRCLFSLQNTPGLSLTLPGIQARHFDVPNGTANFDVALFVEETDGDTVVLLDRKTGVIGPAAALRLRQRVFEMIARICANPAARLSELPRFENVVDAERAAPAAAAPPRTGGDSPARSTRDTELERRIIGVWQDVFKSEGDASFPEIDRDTHFFQIGGDSIRAARLFQRIAEQLGHHLPLATLFEAPTPRLIAERLVDERWVAPFLTLVPVKPMGSRPPVFCLHGGGGNVLQFGFIAEQLHEEQPLYCLQPYELERGALSSVEEMAEHYLQAVRQFRPHGPYLFAGSSLGGAVTLEMAQRLMAEGEEVPFLGLLDYTGPGVRYGIRDRVDEHLTLIRTLSWGGRINYVLRRVLRRMGLATIDEPEPEILDATGPASAALLEASARALDNYVVRPYPGRVVLFRATQGGPHGRADPQGGWGGYVAGVDVCDVPGDHISMTHPPQIHRLARAFAAALERSLEAATNLART